MITDERAEKALRYLASTDEECASLKADVERSEFKAKAIRHAAFLIIEGSVAERTAQAETRPEYVEAQMVHFEAIKKYQAMANKRATEAIVLDMYRTICANRRKG